MAPPPPLGRLPGEKSPSTRPKYTARQPPAPGLLLATSPSAPRPPAWARALPTPSRALSGKPAPPGCAPPARFRGSGLRPAALPARGWGREPGWCARPGYRHSRHPTGDPRTHASCGVAPSVLRALASLPPSISGSATALLAECARVWASPGSPRPGQVPLPPRAAAPAGVGC